MDSPSIFVERTLAMIKPDAVAKAAEIEDIILRSGFTILNKRWIHMSPEQCSEFYIDHASKIFFPSLVAFMSSDKVIAMELARENAIQVWRDLIGPTDSKKAKDSNSESIRGLFGTDAQKNAVHGSDSQASAEREIRFFFNNSIVEPIPQGQSAHDYVNTQINPTLLAGLTQLCKEKPLDPVIWLADWLLTNNPNKPKVNKTQKVIVA